MVYPWSLGDTLYGERRAAAFNEIKRWGLDLRKESNQFVGGTLKLGEILEQVPSKLSETIKNRVYADKALVLAVSGEINDNIMSEIGVRSVNEYTSLVKLMTDFMGSQEMGFAFPAVANYCNTLAAELESSRLSALSEQPPVSLVEQIRAILPAPKIEQTRFEKMRHWFFDHKVFSLLIVIFLVLSAILVFIDKSLDLWGRLQKEYETEIQKDSVINKDVIHSKSPQPTAKGGG